MKRLHVSDLSLRNRERPSVKIYISKCKHLNLIWTAEVEGGIHCPQAGGIDCVNAEIKLLQD